MARKSDPSKARGRPVALPQWWLDAFAIRIRGMSLADAAAKISDAVGRRPPWDRTTLGNFSRGEHATMEMMYAACATFTDLPPAVFVARSFDEAHRLEAVSKDYTDAEREREQAGKDDARAAVVERRGREVDFSIAKMEKVAPAAVASSDGKGVRHGESRGTGRPRRVVQGRQGTRRARS